MPKHPAELAASQVWTGGRLAITFGSWLDRKEWKPKCRINRGISPTDIMALRLAARQGVGIVQLPRMVVEEDLRNRRLIEVLPGWEPKGGIIHAVFPSRRGLLPKVRLLIDYLATRIEKE